MSRRSPRGSTSRASGWPRCASCADVDEAIVEAVNALRARNDYLFTTGGIGPTHDDITVDAIAAALGVRRRPSSARRSRCSNAITRSRGGADRGAAAHGARARGRRPDREPPVGRAGHPHRQRLHHGGRAAHHRGHARRADRHARGRAAGASAARSAAGSPRARSPTCCARPRSAHDGVAIGSYPFFRDGRVGANFVVRSPDEALVDATIADLTARLEAEGRAVVADGI